MPDLNRLKSEMEDGLTQVRRTKTKLAIYGECNEDSGECLNLKHKRDGGVEVRWAGFIPQKTEKTERCDLGHEHEVMKMEKWVWNYCTLSNADVAALIEFLKEQS